ncbi:hypothetical protein ACGFNP_34850 [Nonomuraea sp. NPDC049269]|uniref:hypothetical protein n=1 Tax=Nonomuraea sp. NPDC049269 TaxID=3364349 RepID=UPI003724C485
MITSGRGGSLAWHLGTGVGGGKRPATRYKAVVDLISDVHHAWRQLIADRSLDGAGTVRAVAVAEIRPMDQQSALAEVRELCIELLGERVGQQMAALAHPGFVLKRAGPDTPPTGRKCTIICADPAHAVETAAPPQAEILSMVGLHAAPIITLPSVSGEYSTGDPVLEKFDYRAEPGYDEDHWESPTERFVQGPLREEWHYYCRDRQGFVLGDSQVFGWPHIDSWIGMRADGYEHLLTLSGDLWNDNGFERVMVPSSALQTGKFTNAVCEQDGLH